MKNTARNLYSCVKFMIFVQGNRGQSGSRPAGGQGGRGSGGRPGGRPGEDGGRVRGGDTDTRRGSGGNQVITKLERETRENKK